MFSGSWFLLRPDGNCFLLETHLLLLPDTKVYPAGRQASMTEINRT
jgi:hypothetical protein